MGAEYFLKALYVCTVCVCVCVDPHFSHDRDGGLPFSLGYSVLYQVVHVLVVQQPDQMEGTKACRTAQGQVPDHHGAERKSM